MGIKELILLDINNYVQKFSISKEIRYKYGEIITPFSLIQKMFNLFDLCEFKNKDAKWLDIGTGCGYFSIFLFKCLFNGLAEIILDQEERANHIITNMIYMSEIQEENINILINLFGNKCNILRGDFLSIDITYSFDYIIGNPPYNNNGLKKVPSNKEGNKKNDGDTVWVLFIQKSISYLKYNGKLNVIIPSIWLKKDKAKMNDFMFQYKIEKLHCMNNTETNKIFNKYAQTPTCYFVLTKIPNLGSITVYDNDINSYIEWNTLTCVPLFGCSILKKINRYLNDTNKLQVLKTNIPNKGCIINDVLTTKFIYPNIKTCILDKLSPILVIEYSNISMNYYNIPKLVMAHKMYGFPFIDMSGKYGISNRDNYVIINKSLKELEQLKAFFSTRLALYLFEATRYRMKYLEKYIFELIPDITKLCDFPNNINENTINKYFKLTLLEIDNINKLHSKKYTFFT